MIGGSEECRLSHCPICGVPGLRPRFLVAFPDFSPEMRHVWPLTCEPPVPYWTIVACAGCGVHFPNPFPAKDAVVRYYADQLSHSEWEQVHYVDENELSVGWIEMADKLTRLCGKPGRVLEVGPAAGHLMRALEGLGWSAVGVEATPKFARILRERKLQVHQGDLETFMPSHEFDLIVMFDVLEHLHDPVWDLSRCADLMAPGGRLVVATCDIGSLAARYYGLRWRQVVISHTFYWTRKSLAVALRRAGLEPKDFASVRWWDPEPSRQRIEWVTELGKFGVRKAIQLTWIKAVRRSAAMSTFQSRHPRCERWLEFKVGDQAVMSDVALVVAEHQVA